MTMLSLPGVPNGMCRYVQGTAMLKGVDPEAEFALLDACMALGCNTFDTAENYGGGRSERVLGAWMRARDNRSGLTIIGKGGHPYFGQPRINRGAIREDLFSSLQRLGTGRIDVYLLHRDDPAVPVSVAVDTLNELRDEGHIGAFGGSNWTYDRIREANDYALRNSLQPFTVSSPQFSLAEQLTAPWPGCVSISGDANEAARSWYAESGMLLLIWSSLAGGFFSGRFPLAAEASEDDWHCLGVYGSESNFARLERARELAFRRGASPAQVALAFVLAQAFATSAISGARTPHEVSQNMDALKLSLSAAETDWLLNG